MRKRWLWKGITSPTKYIYMHVYKRPLRQPATRPPARQPTPNQPTSPCRSCVLMFIEAIKIKSTTANATHISWFFFLVFLPDPNRRWPKLPVWTFACYLQFASTTITTAKTQNRTNKPVPEERRSFWFYMCAGISVCFRHSPLVSRLSSSTLAFVF